MAVLAIPPRAAHTVTRQVDGEFLVLDERNDEAHRLEGHAATVWDAAGTTADVDPAALAALVDLGLLDAPGVTRRSMIKRTGAMVGVGIATIALPMASAAASTPPSASITPTTGPKGTVVSLTGSHFAPNKTIQVTVAGVTAVLSSPGATTDINGNIPAGLTFTVPDTGASTGAQPVAVVVNGVSTSAGNFTITVPTITDNPTSGLKGTVVTVNGSGFFPGAGGGISTVTIGGVTVTPSNTTVIANSQTTFTFTVPAGAPTGVDAIVVTDTKGNVATANFTVSTPTLTLNPTSTPLGTAATVTLSGSGYKASSALTIMLDGTTVGSSTSTSGGAIPGSLTITVPATATVGVHTVTVTDASGNVGTATFNVNPTITSPTAAAPVNPGHNTAGPFTIVGTGFEAGATVTGNNSAGTITNVMVVDSTHITGTVKGTGGSGALGSFTVNNPDGTSVTSANGSFKNG